MLWLYEHKTYSNIILLHDVRKVQFRTDLIKIKLLMDTKSIYVCRKFSTKRREIIFLNRVRWTKIK